MTTTPEVHLEELTAGEVMSTALLSVYPHDSVLLAWELMEQAQVHHLPVVHADGTCAGIIDAEAIRAMPLLLSWHRHEVHLLLRNRPLVAVAPDDSLRDVARTLEASGRDAVAVLEDSRLVGLITLRDIVSAAARVQRRERAMHSTSPGLFRLVPVLPSPRDQGPEQD